MYKEIKISAMESDKGIALNELKKGSSGTVSNIKATNTATVQKLLAMGILPGRIIYVIRTYPVYIIQIDNTQVAMDKELAKNIILTKYKKDLV
ncbi:MAG: FeoA family protein [Bacteroidales bacterium]